VKIARSVVSGAIDCEWILVCMVIRDTSGEVKGGIVVAYRLVEVDQQWFASTWSRGTMGGLGHADSGQAMMLVGTGSASGIILSVLGIRGKRLMWWSVHPLEVVELWVCKSHRKALMVPSCAIMKSVHIQFCSLNEESSPVMVGPDGSVKVIGWAQGS